MVSDAVLTVVLPFMWMDALRFPLQVCSAL